MEDITYPNQLLDYQPVRTVQPGWPLQRLDNREEIPEEQNTLYFSSNHCETAP